jgi:trigger factor
VADADVNAFIEQMRHEHATWEPVERPVEDSDLVVLDIDSTLEGAPFLERKQAQFRVAPGTPLPAPGFSEQLIGLERDHRKEFDVDYPADYPRPELAGKKASFKVRVGEVKKEKLPDLDDAFARSVNPEWETLARLREEVTAGLKSRAEAEARAALEERVIDEAAKRAKAEFPPVLVAIEMDRMLEQQLRRFQGGGLDEYLKAMRKTEAEMLTELRPIATQRVSRSLVLDKISQAEGITTTDAEIEAEIEGMAGGAGERKEELERLLRTEQSRETLRQSLVTRKTIQRLVEIAAGPPPEG